MTDSYYMKKALELAATASQNGEIPVGAVAVDNSTGEILGEGRNECENKGSPLLHAEITAIGSAAKKRGSWRLFNTTLFVTLEPCAMCAGAIINARVSRVVFGAYDKRAGACGSAVNLFSLTKTHTPEIRGGVLEKECLALLSDFFKKKRFNRQNKPELWDLYDKDRNSLSCTHIRGVPLKEGTFHTVIVVVTKNSDNRILITKRSRQKNNCPGYWECTTGSVLAGETSISGACRELMEETGIKRKKEDFKLIKTVRSESSFTDCYLLKTDVNADEIKLQKGETEDYKWVDREEFEELQAKGKVFAPDALQYEGLKSLIW